MFLAFMRRGPPSFGMAPGGLPVFVVGGIVAGLVDVGAVGPALGDGVVRPRECVDEARAPAQLDVRARLVGVAGGAAGA